jgi:Uma2 family endonuclease
VETVADLIEQLGGIPAFRIRMKPLPGTATEQDVIELEAREDRLFELIDGILVEKGMGFKESLIAAFLIEVIRAFVRQRKLGLVTAPDGFMRLTARRVRIPDVAYVSWGNVPGGRVPKEPIPSLVPDLAIEVLSESNTRKEMATKRRDYLGNGSKLVWEVSPDERTVDVYCDPKDPDRAQRLSEGDVIDGGDVLPGFSLPLRDIFAVLDEEAPDALP